MFIDHASCSACGARFQPEAIGPGGRCPSCGTTLGAKDLFGVADHLVEEAPENVSFDDLVSGPPSRASRPSAPARPAAPSRPVGRPPGAVSPNSATKPAGGSGGSGGSDVFAMLEEIRRNRGR